MTLGIDQMTVQLQVARVFLPSQANMTTISHSFLHSPTLEAISVAHPADAMQVSTSTLKVEPSVSG